jgi:hypothetical protein
MCRCWFLIVLALSLLDVAVSAQTNQQEKLDPSDGSQGIQVAAGSTTDGRKYHSDYFEFTYSLPDGFVEGTEQYRSRIRALPHHPPDPDKFVLLHAEKRANETADPVGQITVTVDALSRYPKGITEKDFIQRATKAMTSKGDAVLREGEEANVSGWSFFRADYKINGHPITYLTVMLTFKKDFALLLQFSAPSQEEVDSLTDSMQRRLITK